MITGDTRLYANHFPCQDAPSRPGHHAIDPGKGRNEDIWYDHILDDHAEMAGQIDALELAIAHAERVTQDQSSADRQCYYRRGDLPWPYDRDYLKVVVELDDASVDGLRRGVVVTAYPVEAIPRREARIW